MVEPTIIEQNSTASVEALKAKLWRKHRKLSRGALGLKIGYSVQAIQLFERGYDYHGKPLKQRAWTRYRLACAGLDVPDFDWGNATTGARE